MTTLHIWSFLSPQCMGCHTQFWFGRRKHHCRSCGLLFCSECSEQAVPIPTEQLYQPVRVCDRCYVDLSGLPLPPRAIKGSEPNKLNDEETAKECVDTVISGQEDEDDEEEEEDGDEEEDIEEEKTMEESGASYVERKDEVITVQWLVRPRIMVMITWILLDYTVQRCHWQCFDQPPILVLSLIIFHWLLMNKDSANDRCSSLICYRLVEREDIFAGDWLCWRSSTPKTFSSQIKGCRSWQWFLLGVTSKGAGLGFFWVAWFTIWWEVKFLCPWWVLDLQKLLTILYNPYILYRIIINCWWLIVDGTFESNFQIVMPGLFCPVSPHWGSAVKCYAQFRLYVEGTKHCRNFTGW